MNFEILLKRYLGAYWLRPVTALVRTLDALELRLWEAPSTSAELACGDGVNSFLARGGELKPDFDVFETLSLESAEKFFSGVDVYDRMPVSAQNAVAHPANAWLFACDHKKNLIEKAKLLSSYHGYAVKDLNDGLPDSFPRVDFVFSNSIYWLGDLNPVLKDLKKKMNPGATAKFLIVKDNIIDHMAWKKLQGFAFRSLVDAGRHEHYKQLRPIDSWREKFAEHGFKIVSETPMFHPRLMHMIEFHDYREISPIMGFMSKKLNKSDLATAKAEWVSYFSKLFGSAMHDGFLKPTQADSVYTLFELRNDGG